MTISPATERGPLAASIEARLACPDCRGALRVEGTDIRCTNEARGLDAAVADGVVLFGDHSALSFFDERRQVMEVGKQCDGAWCLCYDRQAAAVERVPRFLYPFRVKLYRRAFEPSHRTA